MERIYIFTGKGGVGKTSVAAAHAIKSAEEGKKTLLVSTDMAHNLGDLFEIPIGKRPEAIMENLDAYEIDPEYVMEHDFNDMMLSLLKLLPQGSPRAMEGYGMLPGMEELFALLKINEIYQEGTYERIIVDCAPTGETLSLLKFPELLSWYMEKLFPVGKIAVRVLSPIARQLYKVELPSKAAMSDIEKLYLKLYHLQELLKNREATSIRLVTLPEKMVVEETKRNYMYMNLYNFNVDGLYINRILPEDIANPFFDEWLMIQRKYREQLQESFAAIPIYEIPWYDEELRGMKAVKRICKDALTEDGIFDGKIITQRECFEQNSKGYLMTVNLPFADKSGVDLYQSDSDIIIKINNFKRNIPLPNVLRTYRVTGAKMEGEILSIQFEKGDAAYE
ncbi:MAG TPA: ArsA family ATPase [Clostridiales bacterium]|nr:ArsA family ATPase [Clostridiales bacterium]